MIEQVWTYLGNPSPVWLGALAILSIVWFVIRHQRAKKLENERSHIQSLNDERAQREALQLHLMSQARHDERIMRLDDALHQLVKNGHPEAEEVVIDGMRNVFQLEPLIRFGETRTRDPKSVSELEYDYEVEQEPPSPPVIEIQSCGPFITRPRSEPLYDHETLSPTNTTAKFFATTYRRDDGSHKTFGTDTNLVGNGGSIPRGHYFQCTGFALVPDKDVRQRDLDELLDKGYIQLMLGSTPYATYPARQALVEDGMPRVAITLEVEGTVKEKDGTEVKKMLPLCLAETESFSFNISAPEARFEGKVGLMLFMFGQYFKPLCG